jgi:hypothetical protein
MYDMLLDVKFSVLKSAADIVKDEHTMLKIFYDHIMALDNMLNQVPFDNDIIKNVEDLRIEFFKLCCKYKINNPYMFNRFNLTKQFIDGKINPEIDAQWHKVLMHLWEQGIITIQCCTGHKEYEASLEIDVETAPSMEAYLHNNGVAFGTQWSKPEMMYFKEKLEYPTSRWFFRIAPNDGSKMQRLFDLLLAYNEKYYAKIYSKINKISTNVNKLESIITRLRKEGIDPDKDATYQIAKTLT